MPKPMPLPVVLWFLADAVLSLFPPIHWWAGRPVPVWGLPRFLVYNCGLCAVIAASVIVAYLADSAANDQEGR